MKLRVSPWLPLVLLYAVIPEARADESPPREVLQRRDSPPPPPEPAKIDPAPPAKTEPTKTEPVKVAAPATDTKKAEAGMCSVGAPVAGSGLLALLAIPLLLRRRRR